MVGSARLVELVSCRLLDRRICHSIICCSFQPNAGGAIFSADATCGQSRTAKRLHGVCELVTLIQVTSFVTERARLIHLPPSVAEMNVASLKVLLCSVNVSSPIFSCNVKLGGANWDVLADWTRWVKAKKRVMEKKYLVNVRLGACSTSNDLLDKGRYLSHDVHAV